MTSRGPHTQGESDDGVDRLQAYVHPGAQPHPDLVAWRSQLKHPDLVEILDYGGPVPPDK